MTFPDDDCWYPPGLLENVRDWYGTRPDFAGLSGRPAAPSGRNVVGRFSYDSGPVTRWNVWRRATSTALFFQSDVVRAVGEFDESLGVAPNARFGSAEDIDYPLRALAAGFSIFYDPNVIVHHPEIAQDYNDASIRRGRSYGKGMGRVLRKHNYPLWFVAYHWMRPLGGALLSLLRGRLSKARYHLAVLSGRVAGWLAKP